MEELLELDTILLFRRFVHWQMVQLHGEPAAHEAPPSRGEARGTELPRDEGRGLTVGVPRRRARPGDAARKTHQ